MLATHNRMSAAWHVSYTIHPDKKDHVIINKIWRDDTKRWKVGGDCWKSIEAKDRTVTGLVIGKSDEGISPSRNLHEFKVANPQHIFSYD